jgi:hypothetical protein
MDFGSLFRGAAQLHQRQKERQLIDEDIAYERARRAREQQQWADDDYLRPFKQQAALDALEDQKTQREWALKDRARKEEELRRAEESRELSPWMNPDVNESDDGLTESISPPDQTGDIMGAIVGSMLPGEMQAPVMPSLIDAVERLEDSKLERPTALGREMKKEAKKLEIQTKNLEKQVGLGLKKAPGGKGKGTGSSSASGGDLAKQQTAWRKKYEASRTHWFREAVKNDDPTPDTTADTMARKEVGPEPQPPKPPVKMNPLSPQDMESLGAGFAPDVDLKPKAPPPPARPTPPPPPPADDNFSLPPTQTAPEPSFRGSASIGGGASERTQFNPMMRPLPNPADPAATIQIPKFDPSQRDDLVRPFKTEIPAGIPGQPPSTEPPAGINPQKIFQALPIAMRAFVEQHGVEPDQEALQQLSQALLQADPAMPPGKIIQAWLEFAKPAVSGKIPQQAWGLAMEGAGAVQEFLGIHDPNQMPTIPQDRPVVTPFGLGDSRPPLPVSFDDVLRLQRPRFSGSGVR